MKPAWKNKISMTAKESHLQRACTDYLDILVAQDKIRYCVVPDGDFRRRGKGYCPDIIVWYRFSRRELYCTGGGDVNITRSGIEVVAFELKSPKGNGKLTAKQKEFKEWIGDFECYTITNDFDEFKRVLDTALN